MAVVSNTITGKTRGSVGNVTFTTWKGLNVMKSKPTHVHYPNSLGQMQAKQKLIAVVAFYQSCSPFINLGFSQRAIKKSAYNAFVSKAILSGAISSDGFNAEISLQDLPISDGSLGQTPITSIVKNVNNKTFTFNWNPELTDDGQNNDLANVLIVDEVGLVMASSIGKVNRSAGTITITTSESVEINGHYCGYLFFYQSSSRKVSTSRNAIAV